MPNEKSSPTSDKKPIDTQEKKIDRVAEDAANKASETEQKYDEKRSIFTK